MTTSPLASAAHAVHPESGRPMVELTALGGRARVQIVDALGGWISTLVVEGKPFWLRNQVLPLSNRLAGKALDRTIEPGGAHRSDSTYTEYWGPTGGGDIAGGDFMLGGCAGERIQTPDGKTLDLIDHGFAWYQPPENVNTVASTGPDGAVATTAWKIREQHVALRFVRTLVLGQDGKVSTRYRVTNEGDTAFPHYWSTHDVSFIDEGTRLRLPEGTPLRVYGSGGDLGAGKPVHVKLEGTHRWPHLELSDGSQLNLTRPKDITARFPSWAMKVFSQALSPEQRASGAEGPALEVTQGKVALRIAGSGEAALWLNDGGWQPDTVKRRVGPDGRPVRYVTTAVERSNVASDKTSDAIADGTLEWIQPGESREWAVSYEGTLLEGRASTGSA